MTPVVTLLYEDQRGENRRFGLHELVVASTADRCDEPIWVVRRKLAGRPMKGVNKLLHSARCDLDRIAPDCHPVVAVVDDDRVRDHVGLPASAPAASVAAAVSQGCDLPDKLHVALLVRNMETVVHAAAETVGVSEEIKRQALERKSRLHRDLILGAAARSHDRAVRGAILTRVPSLQELVERLVGLLGCDQARGSPSSPAGPPAAE